MLCRLAPGAPPTPPKFDALNRAIRPISVRGYLLIMLGSGRWQIGCPVECARALEDRAVPCRIPPGWAVGAFLGTTTGR